MIEIIAKSQVAAFGFEIFIVDRKRGVLALPIELQPVAAGAACRPCMIADKTELQGFMDSLWQCGIRPSEGSGSAGSLKAVQDHLDDMRAILKKKGVM